MDILVVGYLKCLLGLQIVNVTSEGDVLVSYLVQTDFRFRPRGNLKAATNSILDGFHGVLGYRFYGAKRAVFVKPGLALKQNIVKRQFAMLRYGYSELNTRGAGWMGQDSQNSTMTFALFI
jgi:hypothetical protein